MDFNKYFDEVAGPESCWKGYKKDGTQAGTGKNKGKRVNKCIPEDGHMKDEKDMKVMKGKKGKKGKKMSFKEYLKEEETYKEFFSKILKKYKVKSPDELSAEQEKKFYDEVDAGWNSDDEAGKDGSKK
jgi:hypothetical protein